MHPTLKTKLTADALLIEQALQQVLSPEPDASSAERWLMDAMAYSCLNGGKRLRPFLVLQTARLLGKHETCQQWDGVVACAIALEMVHCYSLVHDDLPCMDNDDIRRGNPTTHIKYDEHTAVLAGDALLTKAFEVVATAPLPPENRVNAIAELAQCAGAVGMVGGQIIDLQAPLTLSDGDGITRLQRLKTGRLIDAGCALTCHALGATVPQRTALAQYTENIGLAFQITDDILDIVGSSDALGKAVGKDAQVGKATFVHLLGMDGARTKAQSLITTAQQALRGFDGDTSVLHHLADYMVHRSE